MKKRIFITVALIGLFGLIDSCKSSQVATGQTNKEIVRKTFEIVGNGDFDEMDKYISQNYKRHCQATPDLVVESLNDFKAFIREDRKAIPDQQLIVKHLIAENDLVAFWATYKGTQTGQMGPFPPTGKPVELDFSGVHRLVNGKVVETWVTWDNITILSQLGHFPPKP
jgi:predicted ester cyclase